MGHQAQVKLLRKQVKNVAQQNYGPALQNEIVTAAMKELGEKISEKLEKIVESTNKALELQDSQTKSFQQYLMKDAAHQISRELTNIAVTLVAHQRVLCRRLNIEDVPGFEDEVQAEKKVVLDDLAAEAKKREEEEAAAKAAAEAKPAETPAAEAPTAEATPPAETTPPADQI